MNLVFEAPRGQRFHKRFWQITTFTDLMWSDAMRRWVPLGTPWADGERGRSSGINCKSLKAFKRHLRKHHELDGVEVVLVNRFVGYNVTRPVSEAEEVGK